jgi:uncharacterized RDD family membrane protein YckC
MDDQSNRDGQSHQTPQAHSDPATASAPTAAKADLTKRFVAALIDGIIGAVLSFLLGLAIPFIGGILGAAYILLKDGLNLEFMDKRSIGKKLMKLRPVRLDGGVMDINTSVMRNWPLAVGSVISIIPILGWIFGPLAALAFGLIELVLVLTDAEGKRLGDKFASTKVIEVES